MELIKNKKQWKKYKKLMELRLGTMPFTVNIDEPAKYPCLCQGFISQNIGRGFGGWYCVSCEYSGMAVVELVNARNFWFENYFMVASSWFVCFVRIAV